MARMTYEERRGVFAEFESVVASKNEELMRTYLVDYPFLHYRSIGPKGDTALHIVCRLGFASCAQVICDLNLQNRKNRSDMTPLYVACKSGHAECVKVLLRRRTVDASIPDERLHTPLRVACEMGHTEVVRVLLGIFATGGFLNINSVDSNNRTPLHAATLQCRYDIVGLLLGCKHINTRRQNKWGETVLHMVANEFLKRQPARRYPPAEYRKMFHMVSRIFLACADCINVQDTEGNTPLHLACESKHVATLKMCLAVPGLDATVMNNKGETAAHVLVRDGTPSMWKLAVACSAFELNVATSTGASLMDLVWKRGGTNVGRMIIESGRYDVNRVYKGETALTSTLNNYFTFARLSCILPLCSDKTLMHAVARHRRAKLSVVFDEIRVRQRWGFYVDRHRPGVRYARCLVVRMLVLMSKRGYGHARCI